MKRYLFILLLTFNYSLLCSQTTADSSTSAPVEGNKPSKNTFVTVFKGNPGKAALYSLVLPGAGQIYNGQWWKAPIVWGVEGGLFYYAFDSSSRFREFQTGYQQFLDGEITQFRGLTSASQIRLFRDKYQRQKDFAWVYFAVAHLLNVVDAFVSRHLREFDIDEELGIHLFIPDQNPNGLSRNTQFQSGIGIKIDLNRSGR